MLGFSLMAMALPVERLLGGSCYCPKAGHINRETKNVNGHVLVELKNGVDTCANYNAEVDLVMFTNDKEDWGTGQSKRRVRGEVK